MDWLAKFAVIAPLATGFLIPGVVTPDNAKNASQKDRRRSARSLDETPAKEPSDPVLVRLESDRTSIGRYHWSAAPANDENPKGGSPSSSGPRRF